MTLAGNVNWIAQNQIVFKFQYNKVMDALEAPVECLSEPKVKSEVELQFKEMQTLFNFLLINGNHLVKFIIWSKCLFKAASEVRDRNAVCKYSRLIMKLTDFMMYYRKIGYNNAKPTAIELANDKKHWIPYILILKKALAVWLWIRGQRKREY